MSELTTIMNIVVPDIGDSKDVSIIEILVSVGDVVNKDDSLLTLESDKASMEIPAAAAGKIESLSVKVGDTLNAGDIIGTLKAGSADRLSTVSASSQDSAQPDEQDTLASSSTNATAELDSAQRTRQKPDQQSGQSVGRDARRSTGNIASPTAHISDEKIRLAHASPGVRRYAREHGADLSLISGTGPKGRISKSDVITFIKQAMDAIGTRYIHAPGNGSGIPPLPEVDFSKFGEVERVELGRINKLSAANLHRAWLNLPMVTHHELADVTEMESFRKLLKNEAREGDPKITGLAFHMKALVKSLQAFPKLNSSISADGEALFYKHYYHIGIAVDTPNGLVVPVFRDVDKKSIHQLAAEMSDISNRARQKKLKPNEMQGACMTISSLGGIGGVAFTPIINPPEVAILGITKATMQPVWNGKEFMPRLMCPLDLTYDHRVVDGADAARFMAHYVTQISDIRRLSL